MSGWAWFHVLFPLVASALGGAVAFQIITDTRSGNQWGAAFGIALLTFLLIRMQTAYIPDMLDVLEDEWRERNRR